MPAKFRQETLYVLLAALASLRILNLSRLLALHYKNIESLIYQGLVSYML